MKTFPVFPVWELRCRTDTVPLCHVEWLVKPFAVLCHEEGNKNDKPH